ncbi:MAG: hypothetical protein NWP87_02440 [Winogradskyella sp.]|nr:hypothetical protein [Winogradskyella sp.]
MNRFRNFSSESFTRTQDFGSNLFFHLNATPNLQYQILLRKNLIHGPTVFLKRETVNSVGGFDESNRYMEDHPLWLKLTEQGNKVFFLKKITVFYRIHSSSVYGSFSKKKLFNDFYKKRRSLDLKYIYPNINAFERSLKQLEYYRKIVLDTIGFNKNILPFKLIYKISCRLSPYHIYRKIKINSLEKQINSQDQT